MCSVEDSLVTLREDIRALPPFRGSPVLSVSMVHRYRGIRTVQMCILAIVNYTHVFYPGYKVK